MATYMPFYNTKEHGLLSLGNIGGGAAVSALKLARALVKEGLQVDIVAPGAKNCTTEDGGISITWRKDLEVNFINNLFVMGSVRSPLAYRKNREIFHNILKEGKYDIYCPQSPQFSVGPAFAASELGIPTVSASNEYWPVCFTNELYQNRRVCDGCSNFKFIKCIFRKDSFKSGLFPIYLLIKGKSMRIRAEAVKKIYKLVTPSKTTADILVKFGLPREKIVTIRYICDIKEQDSGKFLPYFCWAGRIIEIKGLRVLIRAFSDVVRHFPEAKLYIIGEGKGVFRSEKQFLINMAKKLNILENIIFTGWIPNDEVLKIIVNSMGVVMPSLWPETFGILVMEGMVCRKPIIVTNIEGVSELIKDGYNGFKIPPNNANELRDKMLYILHNPEEARRIGENALITIKENFSSRVIARKYISLFQEALKGA